MSEIMQEKQANRKTLLHGKTAMGIFQEFLCVYVVVDQSTPPNAPQKNYPNFNIFSEKVRVFIGFLLLMVITNFLKVICVASNYLVLVFPLFIMRCQERNPEK